MKHDMEMMNEEFAAALNYEIKNEELRMKNLLPPSIMKLRMKN